MEWPARALLLSFLVERIRNLQGIRIHFDHAVDGGTLLVHVIDALQVFLDDCSRCVFPRLHALSQGINRDLIQLEALDLGRMEYRLTRPCGTERRIRSCRSYAEHTVADESSPVESSFATQGFALLQDLLLLQSSPRYYRTYRMLARSKRPPIMGDLLPSRFQRWYPLLCRAGVVQR